MSSVVFEKNHLFYKLLILNKFNQFYKLKTMSFNDNRHKNFAKISCATPTLIEFTPVQGFEAASKTPLSCFDSLFPISMVNERETNSCKIDMLKPVAGNNRKG